MRIDTQFDLELLNYVTIMIEGGHIIHCCFFSWNFGLKCGRELISFRIRELKRNRIFILTRA